MKLKEILTPSLSDVRKPSVPLVTVSADSEFCQEILAKGWLTEAQMRHAAMRYQLGKSRSGKTIYWMIDEQGHVRDGRIGTSWVSQMLKAREPLLLKDWHACHCLFGMQLKTREAQESVLLGRAQGGGKAPIAVVERELTAVVMSELLPDYTWMAAMYPANLTPESLMPLRNRSVTLFPHTDSSMDNYMAFLELADLLRRECQMEITVSSVLEDNATPEQKERCIDLLDFILVPHGDADLS